MPTELEELVGFISHENPQIRLLSTENLVPYSLSDPTIFKAEELTPVNNLKYLISDHPKIAEHAMNILINISGDPDVLECLATDEKFLDRLFKYIVNPEEVNANLIAMIMANLSKWDGFKSIKDRKQTAPEALGSDDTVLAQLMDLFVKGQNGTYNKDANFDYLAYVFADLSKHDEIRKYFVTEQSHDNVIPLTKLKVFTEHESDVRRKGVASTIKNVAFDVESHPSLLSEQGIDMLPYVLLPITGNEEYDVEETMDMLPDLQLLSPDKKRDSDTTIIQTHIETLMLLTTTRLGRDYMRKVQVYPVVRETHSRVNDEEVREACDRLVQVLMRSEEGEERDDEKRIKEIEDDGEEEITEV